MAALPAMRAQGGGRIGNVVSIGGKVVAPHMLPYTAGKFALTGFTKALYPELANANIYVTGLYPARSGPAAIPTPTSRATATPNTPGSPPAT